MLLLLFLSCNALQHICVTFKFLSLLFNGRIIQIVRLILYKICVIPAAVNSQFDVSGLTPKLGHNLKTFATVSALNDVFPRNSLQRAFRYVFSHLVGVSGC